MRPLKAVGGAAHLQGVHKVLDQEEASHLLEAAVDVGQTSVHVLAESLRGNADVQIYQGSVEVAEKAEDEREEKPCASYYRRRKNTEVPAAVGTNESVHPLFILNEA